ncbi:LppU/SCO3897 family protein [Amycolatopsis speibonae]|uniref:LppU protein n=1 Tax=Amycolatopsis speibonae TaxID=1450224 RepID=A0ABV7NYH4_9PSEU
MSENPGASFPPQNAPHQQWPQQQWPQQQQGWPQQGWPQQPPKKKGLSTKVKVLLLVAALVVVGGGIGLVVVMKSVAGPEKQAGKLTEGDCVVLTGSGKGADAVKTPCDSPQAPYAVSLTGVDKGDWDCKEGFYKYAVPTPMRGEGVALCLAINAKVGLCFDDIGSKTPPPLKDCGSARLRISEVFPQMSVVNSPCKEGTAEVISYASYGTSNFKSATICFVKP